MDTRLTDALPLAARPHLEQYRNTAKDLLKACRSGHNEAVRDWATDWLSRLVRQSSSGEWRLETVPRAVDGIMRDIQSTPLFESGTPLRTASLSDAQVFLARLHGFPSWPKLVGHIKALNRGSSPVSQFEVAADCVVSGNTAKLRELLQEQPSLVSARSMRWHHGTLLHYVAANGHEDFRQRSPKNAVEVARMLLEAGAKVDALADMYGHRCTTMQMLVSSSNTHEAGVQIALVDTLLDFGAAVDGVENDCSPMMTALRFHFPDTAEALARRGARVDNVIAAAALGRTDLVDRFVNETGKLRPHVALASGPWPRLPRDPQVHLGYALTWAAAFGRTEVVELLLRKGVDPSGQDSDASALHFAAAYGRMDLVRLLLTYDASLETLNSYGGTVLDGTVWYALNAPIDDVDYSAVAQELIELGARVDVYPAMKAHVDAVINGRRGGGY